MGAVGKTVADNANGPAQVPYASQEGQVNILSLKPDVLRLIFLQYLNAHERLPLLYTNKKIKSIVLYTTSFKKLNYTTLFNVATKQGYLSQLKWAKELLFPLQISLTAKAAKWKQPEVLKWLVQSAFPKINPRAICNFAARTGQLDLLKSLREIDCPMYASICEPAASEGKLEVLKWLHAQGFALTKTTFANAIDSGDEKVLEWLCEQGCPYDVDAKRSAAMKGLHHIVSKMRSRDTL